MSIRHTEQIAGDNTELFDVSSRAWNRDHTLVTGGSGQLMCRIKTGTYTGDGTVSQAITGVGFQPKFAWLSSKVAVDLAAVVTVFKDDQMDTTYAVYIDAGNWTAVQNRLISLDADGFTVDDDGGDAHPNKNGQVYTYLCLG